MPAPFGSGGVHSCENGTPESRGVFLSKHFKQLRTEQLVIHGKGKPHESVHKTTELKVLMNKYGFFWVGILLAPNRGMLHWWLHSLDLVVCIVVKMVLRRGVLLSKHLKKSRTEQLITLLDSAHNKQIQPSLQPCHPLLPHCWQEYSSFTSDVCSSCSISYLRESGPVKNRNLTWAIDFFT